MIYFNLASLSAWLIERHYSQILLLVDTNTQRDCYPILASYLGDIPHQVLTIAAGERHKNIDTCATIWQAMLRNELDRKAVLVNLGGGVIGDMGGFCASTYKRGIDFVQIPTSLLGQTDASIGGKLGVDFEGLKNVIGVFQNPTSTWIDTCFLATLPLDELRSGLAEVMKHGLIASVAYWQRLPDFFSPQAMDWQYVVAESIEIKKNIVALDFKENDIRKVLNFGHTIGHALESFSLLKAKQQNTKALLHGEAVAIGMMAEAFLSVKYASLPQKDFEAIVRKISNYFHDISLVEYDFVEVAKLALQDKKNQRGHILCTLLSKIGTAVCNQVITEKDVVEALEAIGFKS